MLEPGRVAPQFSLKDTHGVRRSLRENLKNGPVLAVFFKVSCPTCQLTLPFLERLKARVPTIGISQDDAPLTKEFAEYFGISFPILIDPERQLYVVSNMYRLTNVPSTFLIEADGMISWALNGFHKGDLEAMAGKFGVELFTANDHVPAMKPG